MALCYTHITGEAFGKFWWNFTGHMRSSDNQTWHHHSYQPVDSCSVTFAIYLANKWWKIQKHYITALTAKSTTPRISHPLGSTVTHLKVPRSCSVAKSTSGDISALDELGGWIETPHRSAVHQLHDWTQSSQRRRRTQEAVTSCADRIAGQRSEKVGLVRVVAHAERNESSSEPKHDVTNLLVWSWRWAQVELVFDLLKA